MLEEAEGEARRDMRPQRGVFDKVCKNDERDRDQAPAVQRRNAVCLRSRRFLRRARTRHCLSHDPRVTIHGLNRTGMDDEAHRA